MVCRMVGGEKFSTFKHGSIKYSKFNEVGRRRPITGVALFNGLWGRSDAVTANVVVFG